jgi:hypothetical protein
MNTIILGLAMFLVCGRDEEYNLTATVQLRDSKALKVSVLEAKPSMGSKHHQSLFRKIDGSVSRYHEGLPSKIGYIHMLYLNNEEG